MLIHHLHARGELFVRTLAEAYRVRLAIAIPYSVDPTVVARLQKTVDVVVPSSLSELEALAVRNADVSTAPLIIEEIGGYTSEHASELDRAHHIRGVVEDTKQGQWRWRDVHVARLPICSIAGSRLKTVEHSYVGMAIVDGAAHWLHRFGFPGFAGRRVLVLGFGAVGSQVAKWLRHRASTRDLIVFDIDTDKRDEAARAGFSTSADWENIDLVIGTTGSLSHAMHMGDISKFGGEVIMISGSSRRVEFAIQEFRDSASEYDEGIPGLWRYTFGDGRVVYIANQGEPINFRYAWVPSAALDLSYSGLIWWINRLSSTHEPALRPGLQYLSASDENEIFALYREIYGARPGE